MNPQETKQRLLEMGFDEYCCDQALQKSNELELCAQWCMENGTARNSSQQNFSSNFQFSPREASSPPWQASMEELQVGQEVLYFPLAESTAEKEALVLQVNRGTNNTLTYSIILDDNREIEASPSELCPKVESTGSPIQNDRAQENAFDEILAMQLLELGFPEALSQEASRRYSDLKSATKWCCEQTGASETPKAGKGKLGGSNGFDALWQGISSMFNPGNTKTSRSIQPAGEGNKQKKISRGSSKRIQPLNDDKNIDSGGPQPVLPRSNDSNRRWRRCNYHVFLSHVKREAAATARQFKTDLESLLAAKGIGEVKIFLDSDDLQDLNKLKSQVRASANLLVLLTKDIFKSQWCQVEMHTALNSGVVVVPVRIEDDPQRNFDFAEAKRYINSLSESTLDADHLNHLVANNVSVKELKCSLGKVLEIIAKPFRVQASQAIQKAELNEIISSLALEKLDDPVMTWMKYEDGLQINEECSRIVKQESSQGQAPVNIIMVFGHARQGKSFLMNCLSHKDLLFPVSERNYACTKGVQLAREFQSLQDFTGRRSNRNQVPPVIGFVDCEGQGDQGMQYDINLVTPLLLLSKIVIFNWLGRPNKAQMLDTLALLAHSAGQLAEDQSEQAFGDLYIVLRDCPSSEGVEDIIISPEDPSEGRSRNQIKSINERNEVRSQLQRSFRSINFCCMPRPHPDIENQNDLCLDNLNADFLNKLQELRSSIGQRVETPHKFGGQPVTGGLINSLLLRIKNVLQEEDPLISPSSIMHTVVKSEIEGHARAILDGIIPTLEHFSQGLCRVEKVENLDFQLMDKDELKKGTVTLCQDGTLDFAKRCKNFSRQYPELFQEEQKRLLDQLEAHCKRVVDDNSQEWERYDRTRANAKLKADEEARKDEARRKWEREKQSEVDKLQSRLANIALMEGYGAPSFGMSGLGGIDCGDRVVGTREVRGSGSREIYEGPRGGRYTISDRGNKVYERRR
mmetsp:Transcript_14601/g.19103  ORF Transcript_14601/g.19103 Transcript_14601/m.19103 type:complete len:972 (+) Transcript_14601:153-3068(+)